MCLFTEGRGERVVKSKRASENRFCSGSISGEERRGEERRGEERRGEERRGEERRGEEGRGVNFLSASNNLSAQNRKLQVEFFFPTLLF